MSATAVLWLELWSFSFCFSSQTALYSCAFMCLHCLLLCVQCPTGQMEAEGLVFGSESGTTALVQ